MLDNNWRKYWAAHLAHFLQGGFTSALLASGWPVAATLCFAFYVLYQWMTWQQNVQRRKDARLLGEVMPERDLLKRDLKVYGVAFWAGLAAVYVSGWNPVEWLRGIWQ